MNKLLIVVLIMSTFYMEGCVGDSDQAVTYFDSIYLPTQEIIDFDNDFQDEVHSQLIAKGDVDRKFDLVQDEEEYADAIKRIKESYQNLLTAIEHQISVMKNVAVYKDEHAFKKAGLSLLNAYQTVAKNEFEEMIRIFEQDEVSDDDNARFNHLLKQSAKKLDEALDAFYEEASLYGDRYDIEID